MTTIVGYTILSSNDQMHLVNLVKQAISEGWQPLGGVAFTITDGRTGWAQAMIK